MFSALLNFFLQLTVLLKNDKKRCPAAGNCLTLSPIFGNTKLSQARLFYKEKTNALFVEIIQRSGTFYYFFREIVNSVELNSNLTDRI